MDSRRLVVWISTGILGFQGATLAFDLLNCTALSWLYVRMNGTRFKITDTEQKLSACISLSLLELRHGATCKNPK